MQVTLTRYTENPVAAIEEAASNSYQSEIKIPGKIMNQCYSAKHLSVFEFAHFTFHIEGISRACLAQLSRHRLNSLCVMSQRYCEMKDIQWIVPQSIASDNDLLSKYEEIHKDIEKCYHELLESGIPAEDARFVLSNAAPTTLEVSMNLRSLMHFCNLRLCRKAQYEIRELAGLMRDVVANVMPEAKKFLVPQCETNLSHPFCTETKSCGRHPRLVDMLAKSTKEEMVGRKNNA